MVAMRAANGALMSSVALAGLALAALVNMAAFTVYGLDKAAARRGGRRTPELVLHAFALAGGWPGALAARHVFHHKTRQQPFRTLFWCTVALNCAAVWALVLAR